MSTVADVVHLVNTLFGLLDLALLAPAIVHGRDGQQRGRLVALGLVLMGLTAGSAQRLSEGANLTVGAPFLLTGLATFSLFLPESRPYTLIRRLKR